MHVASRLSVSRRIGATIGTTSLLALSLTLEACSLLGLDRFRVVACDECEVLNERDAIDADACERWQCDATGDHCELGPLDADGDGASAVRCGGEDCDDDDRDVAAARDEICDGADNDCNGLVDDVDGDREQLEVVVEGVGSPAILSYAETSTGIVALWSEGGVTQLAAVSGPALVESVTVGARTNARPAQALTDATATAGCPDATFTSLAPSPCEAGDPPCPGTLRCVSAPDGRRVCEAAVRNNTPPAPGECLTHAECQDGAACNGRELCDPTAAPDLVDARGCRAAITASPCDGAICDEAREACIETRAEACTLDELAIAPISSSELLTAGVTTERCALGRARAGWLDRTDAAPALVHWGDDRVTTAWLGLDVGEDGCTGRSRDASAARGASGAALAAAPFEPLLGRVVPAGLVAWRAGPRCAEGACSGGSVELLALWRERTQIDAQSVRFVDASDDGVPMRARAPLTGPGPSVTAWSTTEARSGYVVAYASGSSLALVGLAPPSGPAPSCLDAPGATCLQHEPGPDGAIGTIDDRESSTVLRDPGARTTASMGVAWESTLELGAAITGDVVVAEGVVGADPSRAALAVAVVMGSEIVVLELDLDPARDVVTERSRSRVEANAPRGVSIVALEGGLAREPSGAARAGLVVTWSEAAGTFAARWVGGALVAPGVIALGGPMDRPRAFLDASDPARPRARVLAREGDALVVVPSLCGSAR